tara:strand:- start:504 stop:863 length:360 start_codon:yes stop_codon:yes gene_type:complete
LAFKLFIVDWLIEVLRSISIYFLNHKAYLEVDLYSEQNEEIDMRKIPTMMKKNIIYDKEVVQKRWDICSSCKYLTEGNRCSVCKCYMQTKTKMAFARCPLNPPKWNIYKPGVLNVKSAN